MIKKIDKILKYILLLHKNNVNIILVSEDNFIKKFIINRYINIFNKKNTNTKFFTIDNFLENISRLKIINRQEILFQFFYILNINDFIEKQELINFLKYMPELLNDFSHIDLNMINIENFFSYIISIEKIKRWGTIKKNYFLFQEKAYKYYYLLKNKLLINRIVDKGTLFKQIIYKFNIYFKYNTYKNIFFL